MTIFGSEALGFIVYIGLIPVALLLYFRGTVLPYLIATFWLSGLFVLAINLYYYIPQAFSGAKIAAPLWAGSLMVSSAAIVVLAVSGYLLASLWNAYKDKTFALGTVLYSALALMLMLAAVITVTYAFMTDLGSFTSHSFITAKPLWVVPALFALTTEVLRIKMSLKIHPIFQAGATILLVVGTLLFYKIYITVMLVDNHFLGCVRPMTHDIFLLSSLAIFAAGLLTALWHNRKQT